MTEYVPPKVWTWNQPSGGQFANINRPVAGATHEKALPVGKHPFQLYSLATPNGQKVSIVLEELLEKGHKGAEYDAWPVRIGEGEQFSSGFVDINPNSKIPALVDRSGDEPVRVFESGAILIHLAEKFGEFLPAAGPARAETLSCGRRAPAAPQPVHRRGNSAGPNRRLPFRLRRQRHRIRSRSDHQSSPFWHCGRTSTNRADPRAYEAWLRCSHPLACLRAARG